MFEMSKPQDMDQEKLQTWKKSDSIEKLYVLLEAEAEVEEWGYLSKSF